MVDAPVGAPKFSALLHDIIRNTSLSRDARLLVAVLQMYDWTDGECRASHATMAMDMGCSTRMLRVYLTELIAASIVTEHGAGARRQKVYRLVSIGSTVPIETPPNEQHASDCTPSNRKFSTRQSEVFDTPNRKQVSDSKKKTPVKKTSEEDSSPTGKRNVVEQDVFDYYREKIQPGVRVNAPEKIRTRLKTFTVDELKRGIDNFAADTWWMEHNGARGAAWFFDSDRRSEQFLNLVPRRPEASSPSRRDGTPARPLTAAAAIEARLPSTAHLAQEESF